MVTCITTVATVVDVTCELLQRHGPVCKAMGCSHVVAHTTCTQQQPAPLVLPCAVADTEPCAVADTFTHVLWCTAAAACFKLHSGRRGLQQRWPDLVQGGAAEQPATHMRWHKHGKHQAGTTEALLTCLYGQRHTGLALSGCSVSVPSAARLGLCCTNTPSTCLLQPGGLACARATRCKQTGCQTPFLTA